MKPEDFENLSLGGQGGLTRARWHPEKIRKQANAGRNW